MGQMGANQEDIITVNENTTKYYLMILNYIKTNTILLRDYLDKTRKTANNQTHKFFEDYIEMFLRMTVDFQEKFISNTVTTSTICQTRNLMFFFNEILTRIQGIECTRERLKRLLEASQEDENFI